MRKKLPTSGFTLIRTQLRRNLVSASGFTLIELLLVITITGIMAAIIVPNFRNAQARARDAERKSDMRQIQNALRLYYNDYGKYPASDSSFQILGCGSAGTTACAYGSAWTAGSRTYMDPLPDDPKTTPDYRYTRVNLDSYTVTACLENSGDREGKTAGDWCASAWMYEVKQ